MTLAIVVGTRPEIIKMAPVVRACEARGVACELVHTGQHWSFEMDAVFFADLELPPPRHHLAIGSLAPHAQIAAIVERLGALLERQRYDWVLVEGDTNSVLAAALAANKAGVRVAHVEAGLRSYDRRMPEEINRVLVDHLAEALFAPTEGARDILLGEGIAPERIHVTGNTVVDELMRQRARAHNRGTLERFGVAPQGYLLATVHRAENVDDPERLAGIARGLACTADALGAPVLAAVHPRTRERLAQHGVELAGGVRALPPLGYLDFLALEADARLVLTDSGGLQEEACCLGVPCVTLRDNTERPESIAVGANRLAGADPARIVAAARDMDARTRGWPNPFGDGRSGDRIVALLACD